MLKSPLNTTAAPSALNTFYRQLQKEHNVTQVTVTNHSTTRREVCLWGGNACTVLTTPLEEQKSTLKTIAVEGQAQQVLYNPANRLFYALHPFENAISLYQTTGTYVLNIPLVQPLTAPRPVTGPFTVNLNLPPTFRLPFLGQINPCTMAVNTNATSRNYGTLAVACILTNSIIFINATQTITHRHPLLGRPTDVVYHPLEDSFYAIDGLLGNITKIDASYQSTPFTNLQSAVRLGVDTSLGDLYIHTREGNIAVYTTTGILKARIASGIIGVVTFAYHPEEARMYIGFTQEEQVWVVNPTALEATPVSIPIPAPATLSYNPHERSMYVTHLNGLRISRITQTHNSTTALELPSAGLYIAISNGANRVLVSHARENQFTLWEQKLHPTVTASASYQTYREDFKHRPALIAHLKIVASGRARIRSLRLIERSVNGKETCETLSLTNYVSPQSFCNVLEVFALEGHLLDAHVQWCFTINPEQVVTFMIYYKQLDLYHLLPERARRSWGVQMSKGLPEAWQTINTKPQTL